jgi:hypothetical protein
MTPAKNTTAIERSINAVRKLRGLFCSDMDTLYVTGGLGRRINRITSPSVAFRKYGMAPG